MTKLDGKTPDLAAENIEQLRQIFPDVFEEGKVDFGKLKQVLGEYVDDEKERYNFTWNGKGKALRLAQTPTTGTLRPCEGESKNWDDTQNLYIEGDNLEVLKLLQKSYFHKFRLITIDPPYNTGSDFVYPDNYTDGLNNYKMLTGQIDEAGNLISTNTEANGRYHTNWLNMMYPRLRLARNLLAKNGSIFICIDDNEVDNLKKVCNEIFGETSFVACVVWENFYGRSNAAAISPAHNYVLIYSPCGQDWKNVRNLLSRNEESTSKYRNPDNDPRGPWRAGPIFASGERHEGLMYTITTPSGKKVSPPSGSHWRMTEPDFWKLVQDNRILFGKDGDNIPATKLFLNEVQDGMVPKSIWHYNEAGHTQDAKRELQELFPSAIPFDTPKPLKLIKLFIEIATNEEDYILDFFSGSATTAHATMLKNAEDGTDRKFVMVQFPEPCDANSIAGKAGFNNICEIGKERIRRAGEKIKAEIEEQNAQLKIGEEPKKVPDIGFKVFKLDTSNLKRWQPDYDDLETTLFDSISNYVDGRSELDVVYEIMLKMGMELTWPLETHTIAGKNVYDIGMGALMICLDDHITTEVAEGMAALYKELAPETWRVVFKDNGFENDSAKVNIKEILKRAGLEEDAFTTV